MYKSDVSNWQTDKWEVISTLNPITNFNISNIIQVK